MCSRLGRLRSASACFRRDHTRHTSLSRPRMAAKPGMGAHHSRGVRLGAEPYAVRRAIRVTARPAQNRRFLTPDGRSAPGLVAASDHCPSGLRRHAQRRSPSPAAWAAGLPSHPAVPDEPGNGLRITTAAETILAPARDLGVLDLVILGDSALRLRHCTLTDLEITARQRRRGAPLLRQVIPLLDARSESAWESIMRVLHQAAEIPVTPQHEIFDAQGRFIARADLRTGLGGSTSTTARGIGRLMSTKSIWNATAPSSPSNGSGTASPQSICSGTAPQSRRRRRPARTGPGSRVGWLRGRACSTTRSSDGPAARAPTATGAEPSPKPVSCNKETAAIWVVGDRLRQDGSGALLAALTLGELFARHQRRQHRVPDDFISDDHLGDVIAARNVVHDVEQYLFQDRPQPASASAT